MITTILNIDNKPYVDHAYHIQIGVYNSIDWIVFADNEQEAIDLIIDHYWDQKENYPGYFLTNDALDELTQDQLNSLIYGGNNCVYLTFECNEMQITQYPCDKYVVSCSC